MHPDALVSEKIELEGNQEVAVASFLTAEKTNRTIGQSSSKTGEPRKIRNSQNGSSIAAVSKRSTRREPTGAKGEPKNMQQQKLMFPAAAVGERPSQVAQLQTSRVLTTNEAVTPSPQLLPPSQSPKNYFPAERDSSISTRANSEAEHSFPRHEQRSAVSGTKRTREQSVPLRTTPSGIPPGFQVASSSEAHPLTPQQCNPEKWYHEKQKHQRSQKRAFTSLKDNPFNRFKHDPNDSEAQLEILSSRSPPMHNDSIIPPESLRMLESASRANPPAFSRDVQFRQRRLDKSASRRSFGARPLPTGRDLLAQKADEVNMYEAPIRTAPPHRMASDYDCSQQWYKPLPPQRAPAMNVQQMEAPVYAEPHWHWTPSGGVSTVPVDRVAHQLLPQQAFDYQRQEYQHAARFEQPRVNYRDEGVLSTQPQLHGFSVQMVTEYPTYPTRGTSHHYLPQDMTFEPRSDFSVFAPEYVRPWNP